MVKDNKSNVSKKEFNKWYDEKINSNAIFNFQKEMFEYNFSDTELLARGGMKYRDLFIKISGEDPFQYITIALLCSKIYRHMIPEETIAIMNGS